MITAVLFDFGLVLSGSADPLQWREMQRITGLSEDRFHAAYWAPRHAYDRGTHTGREYWQTVAGHEGIVLDDAQIDALIAADTALWTQPNEPMVSWAARLQDARTKTGILSNMGDEMTLGVLSRCKWVERFDFRLFSHALKLAKPELEIYHHAARGLKTPVEEILFVDDRIENCRAAEESGMQAIQYGEHEAFLAEMTRRGLNELWQHGRIQPV